MSNLARVENIVSTESNFNANDLQYPQLKTYYDEKYKTGWFLMDGAPRPCFTPALLNSISSYHQNVKSEMDRDPSKYDYLVFASNVEGVFNLGGDLNLFHQLIKQKNREKLFAYAIDCITPLYQHMIHLDTNLTTISLVQGDALGGGFEAALSTNVLIAERGSKLGLPEVLFNLFPGMGAFSLLSRKVGQVIAEKIILSGQLYSAEELYELGVIDILAEPNKGEIELYKYIKRSNKINNTHRAMRKVKDRCNPISYKELIDITTIWVDAALDLTQKDLRMMERLVSRQNQKFTTN